MLRREVREGTADALLGFVREATPRWERPDHLRPLAELFARCERGSVRGLSSVPPQHGKTESISAWLVRYLRRHPEKVCAYISYAADVAESKSRRMMQMAGDVGLEVTGKATEWRTRQGGGMLVTGVGGPLTSYGVNGIMVVDDSLKNRQDAESPTIRRGVVDWFTSTALTRLHPGTSVIVNATRWHPEDLTGVLLEQGGWDVVNLPALDAEGRALWPSQRPADFLAQQRRTIGEYDWSSLYMGQPRPRGGSLFREPARYDTPTVRGASILIACDPAATAKTTSDHSAIVVGACRWQDRQLWVDILEVRRLQVEVPALVRELAGMQRHWGAPVAVEAVGGFKAVPQALRSLDRSLRVIDINPRGDKFTRSLDASAAWNDGRIRLPQSAPWVQPFTAEVQAFTGQGDRHDDQVDALSHLVHTATQLLTQRRAPVEINLPFG